MNNSSKTILWLGLIMIIFQIIKDWAEIRAALFGSAGNTGLGVPLIPPFGAPNIPGGGPGGGSGVPAIPPPGRAPQPVGPGEPPPAIEPPPPLELPPVLAAMRYSRTM